MSLIARSILSMVAAAGALFGLANAHAIARDGLTAEDAAIGLPLPAIFFNLNGNQASDDGSQSAARVATAATAREMLLKSPLDAFALWKRAEEVEKASPEQAAKLAALSGRITRRHLPSAIWLLETSVASGTVEGVLTQYDVLLTIWPAIGQRLLPQLISVAAEEPVIRDMLLKKSSRPWYITFLKTAATIDGERFVPHLNQYVRRLSTEDRLAAYGVYFSEMIGAGAVSAARRVSLASAEIPDELFTELQPSVATTDSRWGKMSWTIIRSPAALANLAEDGRSVDIDVVPESSIIVLKRTTAFQPGSYLLKNAASSDPLGDAPRLTWTLACIVSNGPKGRVPIASAVIEAKGSGPREAKLSIPESCNLQEWSIKALTGSGQTNQQVRLTQFALKKLS